MGMTKRDIILASSGFAVAVLIVGGGVFVYNQRNSSKKPAVSSSQTVGDHTIALGGETKTEKSGGLSVNTGESIGQLVNKANQGSNASASGASGGSGGGASIDPSTFKDYDKYASGTSGLFADIQKGTGKELTQGKKAVVVYKGWLTNGTLFDESRTGADGKTQAFAFTLGKGEVIPGWEQGMSNMKEGGIRLLIVPPAVGYGKTGQGAIPPNAVLVFAVQLVSVE